jgi:dienelactone hydrolase
MLRLLGGLVDYRGPLNAKTVKTLDRGRFTIELVHFDSLPDYRIPANLYLPKSPGKHPAVLYSIGHWSEGKLAGQKICSQLALKGFVCLAYDPLGQGERQQAFDARLGKSLIGGATEQHFMAGAQSILLGETVARYFIHDSRRALDYLVSRPEVDPARLGASGCSGGGTQTTFISAFDDRIQAAAPACYMNSFEFLITGPTGDSEQSWPNFLAEGLDQADFVALFAPKPWLIASTQDDFFTPAAAKLVYEQARAFHRIFDREANVKWVVGPGGHGTPLVVREAIYEWMIRHLNQGQGDPTEEPLEERNEADLWVFPQGQVAGLDLSSILARRPRTPAAQRPSLPAPSGLAQTTVLGPPAAREVVIMPEADRASAARARDLALHGLKVILVRAAAYPIADNAGRLSGDWITHTRAWLVGWNLPLLRAADLLAVAREQLPLHEKVYLHGWGTGGIPVLLAAREEPRLAGAWVERTPLSLALALEKPVHKNLHEAVIPGWLRAEDLPALKTAKVWWVDPTDWNENILKSPRPGYYIRPFEQSTAELLTEWRRFTAAARQ